MMYNIYLANKMTNKVLKNSTTILLIVFFLYCFPTVSNALKKPFPSVNLHDRKIPGPLPPNIKGLEPVYDKWIDEPFGLEGGTSMRLDVIRPKVCAGQKLPLCVYIHGGGWRTGNKHGLFKPIKQERIILLQMGFALATVDYRMTEKGRVPHPAQIHDCKLAIRYLRKNADKYGIDPDRIGIWGHSAGGHLVALMGNADEDDGLEGKGCEGFSSRPQTVVEMYGPVDLLQPVGEVGWVGITKELLNCDPKECPDKAINASPVTYATTDDPPTIILHGENDSAILYSQGEIYAKKLMQVGVPVALIKVKNAEHIFVLYPGSKKISPNIAYVKWLIAAQFARYLEPRFYSDLNLDGKINMADFLEMVGQMGNVGAGMDGAPGPDYWNPLADLKSDGRIDTADLLIFLAKWLFL
jgi:acetyl esterase/lipase